MASHHVKLQSILVDNSQSVGIYNCSTNPLHVQNCALVVTHVGKRNSCALMSSRLALMAATDWSVILYCWANNSNPGTFLPIFNHYTKFISCIADALPPHPQALYILAH